MYSHKKFEFKSDTIDLFLILINGCFMRFKLRFMAFAFTLFTGLTTHLTVSAAADGPWQAGLSRRNITPAQPMPMAGYAGRGATHADGTLTPLWCKALVLKDRDGNEAAIVTLDLIGIDAGLSNAVTQAIQSQLDWKRNQIALCTSHTHTGPVVAKNLRPMHYMLLDEANQKLVDDYATFLEKAIVDSVVEARKNMTDAEVSWGSGRATFATNRRNNKEADVPKLREANMLKGPFDHDVPVLTVSQNGKLTGIVFGYACHSTTLSLNQWSGDYGGYAQQKLEADNAGVQAMFWAGCGGDQNPLPRRTVELAQSYGDRLATAVQKVVDGKLSSVDAKLETKYREIDLKLAHIPDKAELERDQKSSNKYTASRAKALSKVLADGDSIPSTYPYPIQHWRLGNDIQWVFLGGEVTIDYAIRIKSEWSPHADGPPPVWVAGYSNDVMAYIPSRRVLLEGGYEGGGAMVYYGLPSPWSSEVETQIMNAVNVMGNRPAK